MVQTNWAHPRAIILEVFRARVFARTLLIVFLVTSTRTVCFFAGFFELLGGLSYLKGRKPVCTRSPTRTRSTLQLQYGSTFESTFVRK